MARVIHLRGPGLTANNAGVGGDLVVAALRGRLFSVVATNLSADTLYLQLYNSTAAPGAGVKPLVSVPVPTVQSASLDWSGGRPCSKGIFVCLSKQVVAYEAAGSDNLIDACYETD